MNKSKTFSTAEPSHLKILESIHNTRIRLSIDALCSRPIQGILTVAGIPYMYSVQTSKWAARISRLFQDITPHPKYIFSNIYTQNMVLKT